MFDNNDTSNIMDIFIKYLAILLIGLLDFDRKMAAWSRSMRYIHILRRNVLHVKHSPHVCNIRRSVYVCLGTDEVQSI